MSRFGAEIVRPWPLAAADNCEAVVCAGVDSVRECPEFATALFFAAVMCFATTGSTDIMDVLLLRRDVFGGILLSARPVLLVRIGTMNVSRSV